MNFDKGLGYGEDLYKQEYTGGTDLAGLLDNVAGLFGQVATKASELGIQTPLDKEIDRLQQGAKKMRTNRFQTESVLRTTVAQIEAQKTIQSARIADGLKQEAGDAIGQSTVALQYYANAIIKGIALVETLKGGRPSAQLAAEYAVQKSMAFTQGAKTESKFSSFFANARQGFDTVLGVKESTVGAQLKVATGEIGKKIQEATARSMQFAPAIPWVVGGFAVLYAINTLSIFAPRRR